MGFPLPTYFHLSKFDVLLIHTTKLPSEGGSRVLICIADGIERALVLQIRVQE